MDSTAAELAREQGISLNKIPLPIIETYEPEALVAAAAAYALAVRKVQAAEKAVAKIKADQVARDQRIAVLQAALAAVTDVEIDCWCANYTDELSPGAAVKTMEVPGHWSDEPFLRASILYENTTKQKTALWYERSINIAPGASGWPAHGELVPSESMTDAAVFYNAAMEPGHLKWKPLWRYGVLLTNQDFHTATNTCAVQLTDAEARVLPEDENELDLNGFSEDEILTNVPISYPPCNGSVFEEGDAVLVLFEGQDRDHPKVIGFRREPKKCPPAWSQVV